MSVRVSRARAELAQGRRPSVVARVAGISRQAIYRVPRRRPRQAGPGRVSNTDAAIVEVAKANPTDGTRMVAALATRELGEPVNRKRVQRIMREHKLLQPTRHTGRRARPGFFQVTRPDELSHMDMTKLWVAQHGWAYMHAIIDCLTREITAWTLDLRARTKEAIDCLEHALAVRHIEPGQLTLGTDNGPQFTSRGFRRHLTDRGIAHTTRRLPRPRVPGLHRVLVWPVQETARLARRMGNPRPRQTGHHQLRQQLPAPTPLRDRLPNTHRTRHHLEARTPTHPSNLNRQHKPGPGHPQHG